MEDSRTRINVNEDGKNQYSVILELNDVVETDAGLYKVKAKNKYGEVSASINLNFSRKCTFTFNFYQVFRLLSLNLVISRIVGVHCYVVSGEDERTS